eukprot:89593-Alexandrium_andersonii.AAC.1
MDSPAPRHLEVGGRPHRSPRPSNVAQTSGWSLYPTQRRGSDSTLHTWPSKSSVQARKTRSSHSRRAGDKVLLCAANAPAS